MDIMNEAMKRRKANGLEITITVEHPGAKGKAAQDLADKTSDLAPNPSDESEPDPMDPNEPAEIAAGEPAEKPFGAHEPMHAKSLSGRAHEAFKSKLKGKHV